MISFYLVYIAIVMIVVVFASGDRSEGAGGRMITSSDRSTGGRDGRICFLVVVLYIYGAARRSTSLVLFMGDGGKEEGVMD